MGPRRRCVPQTKKHNPHFGVLPLYLNRSFKHGTGERLLARLGDGRVEHLALSRQIVPGLLR